MSATVEIRDGQVVLVDPEAESAMRVVAEHNLRSTLKWHGERAAHFMRRAHERGLCGSDVVIVALGVDDPLGGVLAAGLMPGHDWQAYRNRGEVPYARGLAGREGIQAFLDEFAPRAAEALRAHDGLAVVVVDLGAVLVLDAGACS